MGWGHVHLTSPLLVQITAVPFHAELHVARPIHIQIMEEIGHRLLGRLLSSKILLRRGKMVALHFGTLVFKVVFAGRYASLHATTCPKKANETQDCMAIWTAQTATGTRKALHRIWTTQTRALQAAGSHNKSVSTTSCPMRHDMSCS